MSYNLDVIERYNKGEMMHADSIHFPDSLKYTTLLNHRTVYGGGGIMPDYFVPIDTTMYTNYYLSLRDKGAMVQLNIKLIDRHRKEWLQQYKTFDRFNREFEVSQAMLDELVAQGTSMGITYNEAQFRTALPLVKTQLKALLARDIEAGRNVRGLPEDLARAMLEHAGHDVNLGEEIDGAVEL